ncbi:MAG: nucleotidyltransferase domain-containing protein [Candidatus Aenigmarchaeota archaeon]|nr:nucleotidyltransferase domain-containing protein [Candidatus Aenigmarchaeota archaeon]
MKMNKNDLEKMQKIFARDSSIKLAYLFGSYAKGTAGKMSDLDIAVLLDEKLTKRQLDKKERETKKILSTLFTNFHLVIFNKETDIVFKYNIIKDGYLIKNDTIRPRFEYELMNISLDEEYHRRFCSSINNDAKSLVD